MPSIGGMLIDDMPIGRLPIDVGYLTPDSGWYSLAKDTPNIEDGILATIKV